MNIKNQKIKIATILPYKENYSFEKASAASLWVSEFYKNSKYKKTNFIYGHTKSNNYLTKNYINIDLKSLNSKFLSSTNEYSAKLIKALKSKKFDIIEIHNRPLILKKISNSIKAKFIFYFHNDPLSMNGSKTENDRLNILNKIDKLIFVSNWTRERFFTNIDNKLKTKTEVIYPSVSTSKAEKKQKNIIFVGKLNRSKGYDLFKKSVVKILNEFPDWKAISIGDEDRRNIYIDHIRHKEIGFLTHKETLKFLNKSEIAVVPSLWDEPFGRTALEASSRGCATIITNRGGLKETTDEAIILKKIDHKSLYNEIKKLILNEKKRKLIQKKSRKNVKHLISQNTTYIDNVREQCISKFSLNFLQKKIKIINIYNLGQKHNHRLYNISLGKKFTNGFIRNNFDVLEISDRDYIRKNKAFNFIPNANSFQNYLIERFKSYNPDFLFFGHTKNVELNTLDELKSINKSLITCQWNEDPVMPSLKYSKQNISNIKLYSDIVDHNFLTTHSSAITDKKLKNDKLHFFFVPVDKNIECFNVFNLRPNKDLFYAMSHGVNRAILKKGVEDNRIIFLNKLVKKINNVKYDFYGFSNKQPIWGNDFNNALIDSKMGLNLSRGKPTKYYTSNRIASVMGNGLLTFVDEKVKMNHFFNKNEIIFYSNITDLAEKIKFYAKNDKLRKKIAKNGKQKYFKLFNEKKITKYMIDIATGKNVKLF